MVTMLQPVNPVITIIGHVALLVLQSDLDDPGVVPLKESADKKKIEGKGGIVMELNGISGGWLEMLWKQKKGNLMDQLHFFDVFGGLSTRLREIWWIKCAFLGHLMN